MSEIVNWYKRFIVVSGCGSVCYKYTPIEVRWKAQLLAKKNPPNCIGGSDSKSVLGVASQLIRLLNYHDLSFFIFREFVDLGDVDVGLFLDVFEAAAFFVLGDLFVFEHFLECVV